MVALLTAWQNGKFKKEGWLNNIIAGTVVGVVALPLAMAFAIASGLKPEQGLYTAIIAGFIVSAVGGSQYQIAGPTGAFIVLVSGILDQYGLQGLQIATVLSGFMLLLLGLGKVGQFIKFIPVPVIVGFTSGIALIIAVGQLGAFLGLPPIVGHHFYQKVIHLILLLPHLHLPTMGLACMSLAILLLTPNLKGLKKVPAPLLVLLVGTSLQAVFMFKGVATIGTQFGGIPQGLPNVSGLPFHPSQVFGLIGPAFTLAMLGAIESLLSAVVADGMTATRHDSNQELVAQGVANIVVPFFGGFAATGALARTATNIRYGGDSPLAGIVHAVVLTLVLVLMAPLAIHIPLYSLAAILLVVAFNMSELGHFSHIVRYAPKADVLILLVTFTLTVLTDLVTAVNVGMILTMFHLMSRLSSAAEVRTIEGDALTEKLQRPLAQHIPSALVVYSPQGPFFFCAAESFQHALSDTHTDPQVVLIRMGHVPFIDVTGLEALKTTILNIQNRNITVLMSEANTGVHYQMSRMGIMTVLGVNGYFHTFSAALEHADQLTV
jgi:sulfate permease, SulP family